MLGQNTSIYMIHTLVSTRSLEFVYKMEIYKNSIDIESLSSSMMCTLYIKSVSVIVKKSFK